MTVGTMSPRLVLGAIGSDGAPPLPQSIGATTVWTERLPCDLPPFSQAWEHRGPGVLVVIALVAQVDATHALWAAWVPSLFGRTGDDPLWDSLIPALHAATRVQGWWAVAENGTIGALESDTSAAAVTALSVWPATWRAWAAGDVVPDPSTNTTGTAPSGPRKLIGGLA